MTTKEIVKDLARKRHITLAELERKLDIANGTIGKWERSQPSAEALKKLAEFFSVSTDYLLGITDNPNSYTSTTIPTDLDKILDSMMSFDGKPMTEHDRETIRAYLEGKFSNK